MGGQLILELLGEGHIVEGVLDATQQREVAREALVQLGADEVAGVRREVV